MNTEGEPELLSQAVTVFTWSLKLLEEKVHKQQQQKQVNLTSNKMLKFFAIKDLINRVQRQLMEWKKIFANIYLIQNIWVTLTTHQQQSPYGQRTLKKSFVSKEDIQVT